MKTISVVIPAYNVEKYLAKCIDSVVKSANQNIEIIVVNDGSTDNSEAIISEYKEKYPYIKYIKKTNGGLSDARNEGVKYANGDYLCFVDSDDYISESLFQDLEKYIDNDYDLIKYKMIKVDENYNEIERVDGPVFECKSGEAAFNELYGSDVMLQPAWLYLYKKSFWDENKFEYPVGKKHEDFAITSLVMLKAKTVASTNVYGYYYVQSSSSITRGIDEEKKFNMAKDLLEHYDYMIVKIKEYDISDKTKENLKAYYTNCIILKLKDLSGDRKKEFIKEIKKRNMYKNIKIRNIRQLIKRALLAVNVDLYLRMK